MDCCRQAKKSEQLEFYFGLNANERYHDGMFFYNSDRLIKMYVKEGTLQSKEEMYVFIYLYNITAHFFSNLLYDLNSWFMSYQLSLLSALVPPPPPERQLHLCWWRVGGRRVACNHTGCMTTEITSVAQEQSWSGCSFSHHGDPGHHAQRRRGPPCSLLRAMAAVSSVISKPGGNS